MFKQSTSRIDLDSNRSKDLSFSTTKKDFKVQNIENIQYLTSEELYVRALNFDSGSNGMELDQIKAYEIYLELADRMYHPAEYKLGNLYLSNKFCPLFQQSLGKKPSLPNLIEQLKEAYYIEDNMDAKDILDRIYRCNLYSAKKLFESAVNNGSVEALFGLGEIYYQNFYSVLHDLKKAKEFFTKAVEKNHVLAKYRLGEIYYQENQKKIAIKLYKEAAREGCADAIYKLAVICDQEDSPYSNPKLATKMFIKASNSGHPDAQCMLGKKYVKGSKYLPKDTDKTLYNYLTSAENGSAEAQNVMGWILDSGHLLEEVEERNVYEAVKWYRKSAGQSYKEAFFNLANIYLEGRLSPVFSIELNIHQAVRLFRKAAVLGHIASKHNLVTLYSLLYHEVLEFINNKAYKNHIEHNRWLAEFYSEQKEFWRFSEEEQDNFNLFLDNGRNQKENSYKLNKEEFTNYYDQNLKLIKKTSIKEEILAEEQNTSKNRKRKLLPT